MMDATRWVWIVTAMLTIGLNPGMSGSASAEGVDGPIRLLLGSGVHALGPLCAGTNPCPGAATAANQDRVELSGEGILLDGSNPRASGGGSYRQLDAQGDLVDVGNWFITSLDSFESYGGSASGPPEWLQGRALIQIQLVSQFDGLMSMATLEVGAVLDDAIEVAPAGTIQGMRLEVVNGPVYEIPDEPRATLFIISEALPPDGNGDGDGTDPPEQGGGFDNAQLSYEWRFGINNPPVEGPTDFVVGDGVDLMGVVIGRIDVDVSSNELCLNWTGGLAFSSAAFNGLVFQDSADSLPAFSSAMVSVTSTFAGFDATRVTVTENSIEIDLGGLDTNAGDQVCVAITF